MLVCWYKRLVSRHGYNEGANGKQALKARFYLNRFTSHRATKTWGSRELFHSDLFSSVSNDSKWFTSESFVCLYIRNDRQLKSSRRSPQTQLANFACSRRLTTILIQSLKPFLVVTSLFSCFWWWWINWIWYQFFRSVILFATPHKKTSCSS